MRFARTVLFTVPLLLMQVAPGAGAETKTFVGSAACKDCHEAEYGRFRQYSKKAVSWEHVSRMMPKLTVEEQTSCYECHTTGYGKGGFVSYEKTPHLADVGCETCHGPGGEHAQTGDPATIGKPTMATCETCHDATRVKSFGFKPLIHSGAH